MTFDRKTPFGTIVQSTCPNNAGHGVQFRTFVGGEARAGHAGGRRAWLSRLGGAFWLGTFLTASPIGVAVAPAAASDGTGAGEREEATARIEVSVAPADRADPPRQTQKSTHQAKPEAPVNSPRASPGLPGQELAQPDSEESLVFGGVTVSRTLVETVIRAAQVTAVDPVYMLALADKESSFSAQAKAGTSSAEGLFQFVGATWLEMIRNYGSKHGYEAAAGAIETVRGELTIANDVMREWVLGLRRDAYLSALMAAEMLKRDRAKVERRIGRDLSRSECYFMHFLGAASAGKLIEIVNGKPKQSAPRAFPQAAKANKTLFFTREGRGSRHLTVAEFYHRLDRMIDVRLDRYLGASGVHAMLRNPL